MALTTPVFSSAHTISRDIESERRCSVHQLQRQPIRSWIGPIPGCNGRSSRFHSIDSAVLHLRKLLAAGCRCGNFSHGFGTGIESFLRFQLAAAILRLGTKRHRRAAHDLHQHVGCQYVFHFHRRWRASTLGSHWKGNGTVSPPTQSNAPSWPLWTFWQWSDGADSIAQASQVPGTSVSVDRDVYAGTTAQLNALWFTLFPATTTMMATSTEPTGLFGTTRVVRPSTWRPTETTTKW